MTQDNFVQTFSTVSLGLGSHLALSIDAYVQRVGLASRAVDDSGRTFGVEVVAFGQTV